MLLYDKSAKFCKYTLLKNYGKLHWYCFCLGFIIIFYGLLEELLLMVIWGIAGILSALISGYILKGLSKSVTRAKVWGPSSKFPGQIIGLNHTLKDKDIIEFQTK